MRIALLGLAALLPSLASADDVSASPAPYVLHQGRAVRAESGTPSAGPSAQGGSEQGRSSATNAHQVSHFGAPVHTSIVGGRGSFNRATPIPRSFRGSSSRRGVAGTRSAASSDSTPPAYAVPGAKIISEGQQPVYSQAAGGGTHSIEGGGFIAMDQAKAHDVGRAPGITWAPPDTPPSANKLGSGGSGGTGASANGPAPVSTSGGSSSSGGSGGSSTSGDGNGHISGTGNGGDNNNGSNGNGNGGNGNNGGDNNNMIGGGLAF